MVVGGAPGRGGFGLGDGIAGPRDDAAGGAIPLAVVDPGLPQVRLTAPPEGLQAQGPDRVRDRDLPLRGTRGRLTGTPHFGLGLSEAGRDFRLGAVPLYDLRVDLILEATRWEAAAARPEHGLTLSGALLPAGVPRLTRPRPTR